MAFQYQVSDAKRSGLKHVSALCVDSDDFLDLLNTLQRRLAKRGGWFDTEWLMRVCLSDACITWPRFVGTVRGVRPCSCCGSGEAEMRNRWYAILGNGSGCCSGFCSSVVIRDANSSPCINEVAGETGSYLRYYVVKRNDLGKTIRIFGKEYGAQPLQEKDGTGHWVDGITLTSAVPYAQSMKLVARNGISAVVRQATEGMAYLYEYNPTTGLMRDLGAYEPNETNPRYRRSVVQNLGAISGTTDANGICQRTVEALVKMQFVPLSNDNDFLMIDDFDALELMALAVKAERAGEIALSEAFIIKAVRELNFNERDKSPDNQTVIKVLAVNGRMITNPV